MSAGRTLRRIGWSAWTLLLAGLLAVGVEGVIGPVTQTSGYPVCRGSAIAVAVDEAGSSRECHGDAVAQVWLATAFTLGVALTLGGRIRVVVALRRHCRRVGATSGPSAIAVIATRRAHRRDLCRTTLLLLGASICFGAFLWTLDSSSRRSDDLARRGVRVSGEVVRVRSGGKSSPTVEYTYRSGGLLRSGSVEPGGSGSEYEPGATVVVLVHPDDPTRSTIAGEEEDITSGAFVVFFVTLVGGSAMLTLAAPRALGWWRMGALLASQPWREVTVRPRAWVGFRVSRTIALIEDAGSSEVVGLAPYLEPSLITVARGKVWAVGAPGVGYVLAPEGGEPLIWAPRSALPLRRLRWRRAFAPTSD